MQQNFLDFDPCKRTSNVISATENFELFSLQQKKEFHHLQQKYFHLQLKNVKFHPLQIFLIFLLPQQEKFNWSIIVWIFFPVTKEFKFSSCIRIFFNFSLRQENVKCRPCRKKIQFLTL